MRYAVTIAAAAFGLALTGSPASAKPCQAHQGTERTTCLRQWKRDHMAWPPRPRKWEIIKRVGRANYAKAIRVSYCETGHNLRHYAHSTYRGMLGMYVATYNYGARATGYPQPDRATEQQQVAIAVAAHSITRGWSGWGCGYA